MGAWLERVQPTPFFFACVFPDHFSEWISHLFSCHMPATRMFADGEGVIGSASRELVRLFMVPSRPIRDKPSEKQHCGLQEPRR